MKDDKIVLFGIIACLIAHFILTYSLTCTSTLTHHISDSFEISSNLAIWVANAQYIGSVGFVGVAKLLMNKYGKKHALILGVAGVIMTSIPILYVDTSTVFFILRFISGIASAFIYVASVSFLTDLSTIENRDFIMSLNSASSCLGAVCGPLTMLFTEVGLEWQSVFVPIIVLGVLSIVMLFHVQESPYHESVKIDYISHGFFMIGISLVLNSAMSMTYEYCIHLFVLGTVLLILGAIHGYHKGTSVIDIGLIVRNRMFMYTIMSTFVFFLIQYGLIGACSYYLQVSSLSSAITFALYVTVTFSLIQLFFSPIVGKISCNIDRRILPTASMVIMIAASSLCILGLNDDNAPIITLTVSILVGVASSGFVGPNASRVMSSVVRSDRAAASAILTLVKQITRVLGSILFVQIATVISRSTEVETYSDSAAILGMLCLLLAVIGACACIKGPKTLEN